MRRLSVARRDLRADDGASLLLALALVVGVAVIVAAVASYASVSIGTVNEQRDAVQRSYDVDGALQVAVDTVRLGSYNQDIDSTARCLGTTDVVKVPTAVSGPVAVRCTPKPGTGADSGKVRIVDDNRFADAIFTGNGGLHQDVRASVLVRGDVSSRAGISVDGGPSCATDPGYPGGGTSCGGLWSDGDVQAAGACSGTVVSIAGNRACNAGTPGTPDASSPAPSSTVPYRHVGSCGSYGSTAEFAPGYYDDAAALNALTNGSCSKTFVFRPGNYYFDFRNEDASPSLPWPVPETANEWEVNDPRITIIGGDPSGQSFVNGACVSPLEQTGDHGVRFVFGGNSRLRIRSGTVSLCGTYSMTDKPIAIFGATSGANSAVTATGTPSAGTTGNSSGGGFQPSDPGQMAQRVTFADGSTTDVAMTRQPGGPQTLWGQFGGYFGGPAAIPEGSILTSATLNLRHKETGARAGETVRVTFDPGPGAPLVPAVQPGTRQALGTDSVDLLSQALVDTVHDRGLNGGTVRYELTTVPGTGNIDPAIDLATLTFTWIPPGIRAQTAGTTTIRTSGGNTRFRVDGGIYTRQGSIDLRLSDVNYLVVSAGIVAQQMDLGIEPSATRTGPVIQTPKKSDGPADLTVFLVAYTCSGSCGSSDPPGGSWAQEGTAEATFKDTDSSPGAPNRKVSVDSWHLER